ncbi:MAG: mechanosensitive ion channel family protein [Sphingobacterium sp.]
MGDLQMDNVDNIQDNLDKFKNSIIEYAPMYISAFISALLILVLGLWMIKLVNRLVARVFERKKFDISIRTFVGNLINWILKIILFIVVVSQLGVQTSTFIAIIGAAGLAIGLSLQGSLSNFAGGVLILTFKPFTIGDYISSSSGVSGTVTLIDIFNTKLTTPQNQLVVVPNGELSNSSITNYSVLGVRRTWFDIGISYDADLKKTKEILLEVVDNNSFAFKEPAPQIVVTNLGDNSVNLSVRVTTSNEDFWTMNEQLIVDCKMALDAAGIGIPYPQRDLHIIEKLSK